jgi:hypothetical protein
MFFIGKRLYSVKVGVLAAALGAATVLQIQQSHFTADVFATFSSSRRCFSSSAWAIPSRGLTPSQPALSANACSRINVVPIVGILAVALFVPVISRWHDPQHKATIESARRAW